MTLYPRLYLPIGGHGRCQQCMCWCLRLLIIIRFVKEVWLGLPWRVNCVVLSVDADKEMTGCIPFLGCHPKRVSPRSSDVQPRQALLCGLPWREYGIVCQSFQEVEGGVRRKSHASVCNWRGNDPGKESKLSFPSPQPFLISASQRKK